MKIGDEVSGELFENGVVVALGPAEELLRFDVSGALRDGIDEGSVEESQPCVAVRLVESRVQKAKGSHNG